jgi:hypothetical protein
MTLTVSSDVDALNLHLGGHQEQVQQHGTMRAISSSAYPASRLFTDEQNVTFPASMASPIEAGENEDFKILCDLWAEQPEGLLEQNIQPRVGQPSSPPRGLPVGAVVSFEDLMG